MNGLCPECGNPPEYHSFCSICCKLFTGGGARWGAVCNRMIRAGEKHATAQAIAQEKRATREAILAKVRALREQDVEAADAEAALGMQPGQLRAYCIMTGLPPFRRPPRRAKATPQKRPKQKAWPSERVAALKRLLRDGVTYRAAAATLGVTVGAVAGAIRDHRHESADARREVSP